MDKTAGEKIMDDATIILETTSSGLIVHFSKPTVVCIGKYKVGTAPAYKGSLSGSRRNVMKWGVDIYDPDAPKSGWTKRHHDTKTNTPFIFELSKTQTFENKIELRQFLETANISPFVELRKFYTTKNYPA